VAGLRRKEAAVLKQSRSPRWRQSAVAATVVAASAAVTLGVDTWPADGQPQTAEPAVTRIGSLPEGAALTRGDGPAGRVLERVTERRRRRAARAAREARELRASASRSASRTVSYDGDPRRLARAMMAERYGWGAGQYSCLSSLWERESGWDVHAANPSSGAYGIPQALPGSKMSTYGADWQDDPVTQIQWGLAYIRQSHATPCGAWSTFRSKGWY
jgi:hypothetical protein